MKNWKKVLILGLALLIIAGIVVVALKGFKVSLLYGKHESIELNINKDVDFDAVNDICKEVFGDRKFAVKKVEMFNDSFQVNVEYVTDEEKESLITKINEKFEVEKTLDDFKISTVSKVRIRDNVKMYIVPLLIVYISSYIYILIRFRKIEPLKIILNNFYKTVLTEAGLLSFIAIARIPVVSSMFFVLTLIAIGELTYCFDKSEKKLNALKMEKK